MRRHLDIASLIWGLLFATMAGLGIADASGSPISWQTVGLLAPAVLIALGALGLVLHRTFPQEKP